MRLFIGASLPAATWQGLMLARTRGQGRVGIEVEGEGAGGDGGRRKGGEVLGEGVREEEEHRQKKSFSKKEQQELRKLEIKEE